MKKQPLLESLSIAAFSNNEHTNANRQIKANHSMKRILLFSCATLAIACVVLAWQYTKPGPTANAAGPRRVAQGHRQAAPAKESKIAPVERPGQPYAAQTSPTAAATLPVSDGAFAAGNILYIDPNTGWPGQPPAEVFATVGTNAAFSTSTQGLQESPSPIQAGGFLVDLQGRFQNALVVTRGSDGKPAATCGPTLPPPGAASADAHPHSRGQR